MRVFQNRLEAAFPEPTWGALLRSLRDGIRLGDAAIEQTPLLRFVTGQDLRGHIRRAAILYQIRESCRLNELPFQAEPAKMPVGNWHWLEIKSANIVTHVVRTDSPKQIPEITSNRQPKFLKNEYDLYDDGRIPPLDDIMKSDEELYSTITFGANHMGDLTHAALGMPSKDGFEWLAYVNLLRKQSTTSEDMPPPAPPPVDPTKMLKFVKSIEEAQDNGHKKQDGEKSA